MSSDSMANASPSIYERIRDDIVEGRLLPNERLKVSSLAASYGTSNNPVREALQQLRGEGFVIFLPNRGARVRPIDDAFVRDITDIEILLEPYFTRFFVEVASAADIDRLQEIQDQIEQVGFEDRERFNALDTQFHTLMYDRHFNTHALDLWWKHREILGALSRNTSFAPWRVSAIVSEHRELIECVRQHDAAGAAAVIERHVTGSGRHNSEQLRARRLRTRGL